MTQHLLFSTLLLLISLPLTRSSRLKILTYDTAPKDGTKRFLYSANFSNIDVQVLQKQTDLVKLLEVEYPTGVVIFCDSSFASIAGTEGDIIRRWKANGVDVLVDLSTGEDMLKVNCVIGESPRVVELLRLVESQKGGADADEFLVYAENNFDFSVALDVHSRVFLNMDRYPNMVGYTSNKEKFFNFETNDSPPILIGSIKSYTVFNRLSNYVPGVFDWDLVRTTNTKHSSGRECLACPFYHPVDKKEIFNQAYDYPVIVTAFYIKEDVPFLDLALDRFRSLTWKSGSRVIVVLNKLAHREKVVEEFFTVLAKMNNVFLAKLNFDSSMKESKSNANMHDAVKQICRDYNCSLIWHQNSDVANIHYDTLEQLASWNFSIMAPMILSDINTELPSANFWGDVAENGFYKRSQDYFDIVKRKLGGIFSVPFITGAYLIKGSVDMELSYRDSYYKDGDSDIVFCNSVRKAGHIMFLKAVGRVDGVFINGRTNKTVPYPFFEFFPENHTPFFLGFYFQWDHYRTRDIRQGGTSSVPCEDVYVSKLFQHHFTDNMRNMAISSDKWNSRAWTPGWEKVDTLSFTDIGLRYAWEDFSKYYLPTLVDRRFTGFRSDSDPIFPFFMRMTNESLEVPLLEGNGVYTIVIPLSNNTMEYFGEGMEFNDGCKLDAVVGDLVLFPSRLTHRWRPIVPVNGTMIYLVSFYN